MQVVIVKMVKMMIDKLSCVIGGACEVDCIWFSV